MSPPHSHLPWAACSVWRYDGGGLGGCLDTGPFVPNPAWLLGMRLSCSQIHTQRGQGRLWRGWGWGLSTRAPSQCPTSQMLAAAPQVGWCPQHRVLGAGEEGPTWHPLAATLPSVLLCQACLQAHANRGEAQRGGGGLEGPRCAYWGRPEGSGTSCQCLADDSFSPVPTEWCCAQ